MIDSEAISRMRGSLLMLLLALLWLASGTALAQVCAAAGGTRGPNAFALNGTFGILPGSPSILPPVSQPLSPGRTTLRYNSTGFLQDGDYRISNRTNPQQDGSVDPNWWNVGDHDTDPSATGTGPSTGLMMVINASIAPSVFYQETVTVTPNTNYEFSAWLLHNNNPNAQFWKNIGKSPLPYNVSFEVERVGVDPPGTGIVIASTGPVGATPTPQWRNFGILFNSGNTTQLIFRFRNSGPGGNGNDLSMDDIVVAPCTLPSGNVGGTLYIDQNANGVFDPGTDTPLPAGIDVQLVNASGQIVAQSQTDADGNYAFNGVPLGTYAVRVVTTSPNIPPGAIPTAPASASYTGVVVGANTTAVRNFGFQSPQLGLAKTITSSVQTGPTTYAVNYSVIVQNTGTVDVPKVQVVENLLRAFSPVPAANISVSNVALAASSTAACVLNGGFTGKGNNTLLDGNGILTPGQQCTITYTVNVDVGSNAGPFNNTVYGSGFTGSGPNPGQTVPDNPAQAPTLPVGTVAPAVSNNGTTPSGPGSPTPSTPQPQQVGVAKAITSSTQIAPTTFAINYSVVIKNVRSVNATKVQAVENLVRAFSPVPAANISVSNLTLGAGSSAACLLNSGFNGIGNNTLLDGNGTLTPGQSCVVSYTVTVNIASNPGPFDNTVYGSSYTGSGSNPGLGVPNDPAQAPTLPAGTVSTDLSNNGTDPNPSGDGNPNKPSENNPTPFIPVEQRIGIAKAVTGVVQVNQNVFDVTYLLTLKNYAQTPATNVQVTDNLASTFPAPATFVVQGAPVVAGDLSANNPGYNGNSDTKLLAGNQNLAVGATATIVLTVRVTTNGATGVFNNSAIVTSANSPGGPPIATDISTNGTNPNPTGDGNPSGPGEDVPTPVTLPPQVVGLAKMVTSTKLVSPGVFEVGFLFTYKNLGSIPATNVQVTDDLSRTFPAPSTFVVTAPPSTSGGLAPNPNYNGLTDTRLLIGNQPLAVGGVGTLSFTLRVTQNGTKGPYYNSATLTSALTPGGPPVWTTDSNNGNNPDPAGNGNPNLPGGNQPTPVYPPTLSGVLVLSKTSSTQVAKVGAAITWQLTASNTSGVALSNVSITDTLPVGLQYVSGSSTLGGLAIPDPTVTGVGAQQQLRWNLPSLAEGQSVNLQLKTLVTAAARNPIQNTAQAGGQFGPGGSVPVTSTVATAVVNIDPGVFSNKAQILGRVYFDKNGDNNYTEGLDEPLQGARVYLSNGRFAVTDDKGRYSLTDVEPGLWAIRVDRVTAPYVPKAVPDDQGQRGTRYVRIEGAGIYHEDFLFEAPASDTAKVRSTKVTMGKVSLEKLVSKVGQSYTITLKLTVGTTLRNLRITDPLPPGGTRGDLSGTPTPAISGDVITLPGTLEPGFYTLTYTLSGDIALERLVTDPDLNFEEVAR
ncbi:MAG: DUF11 domain-containing protein [Thermaceae bacterium]|nr:DUF11 domain-containing protein [Thermaceae bacterium]